MEKGYIVGETLEKINITDLTKQTIQFLEATKKDYVRYSEERKKLFDFSRTQDNLLQWQLYLKECQDKKNIVKK